MSNSRLNSVKWAEHGCAEAEWAEAGWAEQGCAEAEWAVRIDVQMSG